MNGTMSSARPRILIKVTFLKHFAFEVWVSIGLALAITAVQITLTSRFPTTGYARVLLFIMYKARAWRNGYRMFISVYILC